MDKKIEAYSGPAGGWGALKAVAKALREQMNIRDDVIALFDMNKAEGFDCPGCAWPDPKYTASFDICENGAKAVSWEATSKRVTPEFFAHHTVSELFEWGDFELEDSGRLTHPLKYCAAKDCYEPIEWKVAFNEIGTQLRQYYDPNVVEFYTSGRTSNEAAFLSTVRSHDQYNTTLYGMNDRYRGVFGRRDVVFISVEQAKLCGVNAGDKVNLIALLPDGRRSTRSMEGLTVVIYNMAVRSLVTYFPEASHMLALDNYDVQSGIPAYKSIPVAMDKCLPNSSNFS